MSWSSNVVNELTVDGTKLDALQASVDLVDANVDLIKIETDKIPATIVKVDDIKTAVETDIPASLVTIDGEVGDIKTETDKIPATITKIDAIKTETDKIPATITKVDAIKTETDKIASIITKIGTPANTGGTADIASILGDPWGDSLVVRLAAIKEVIGALTDTYANDTIFGILEGLSDHAHGPQKVYPSLSNGITVTGGVPSWTLGDFIEVIPVDTIASPFDIHYLDISAVSATDSYELVLYKGTAGNEVEIGRASFTRQTAQSGVAPIRIQTEVVPANTRVSAKIASATGASDTATFKCFYHTY